MEDNITRFDMNNVTRFEVINHTNDATVVTSDAARCLVALNVTVTLIAQDNGTTLKVFLEDSRNGSAHVDGSPGVAAGTD